MSGKYVKKKNKQKTQWGVLLIVIGCLAAVCAAVGWLLTDNPPVSDSGTLSPTTIRETTPTEVTAPIHLDAVEEVSINLGSGMRITDVGKYTGIYMEDGSDEIVSGILMIAVTNEGEDVIRYAEISMPVGERTAHFSLSTLPVGCTVILLEQSRMAYEAGDYTSAVAENVVLFDAPLDLCADRLKIQILDGAINVSNISGADIAGDIVIYYKNSAADVYYGGITYRVRLEGGLKSGELKQIMASHFSDTGSTIMFVTCGES